MERLYPQGASWLQRRLDEVETRRAQAIVAVCGNRLAGVAIETPKETGRLKLSTLWTHPAHRRQGVGRSLLVHGRRAWLERGVDRTDVTCAASAAASLAPLLHASGFSLQHLERDRYGEGRHELVFSWFPDADPWSAGPRIPGGTSTTSY
ncbi:MAG: GNAT family N-acetyltransferase [Solirubrobacterales bacterium]